MTFSTTISQLRRELNLTQAELAAALGVDKQSVSNWECGRNAPWPARQATLLASLKKRTGELPKPGKTPIHQREDNGTMNFHSGTSRYDFIAWLRDAAIKGGMPAGFIDCVDALDDAADLEAELETQGEELYQAEKDRDDLREELSTLVDALDDGVEDYPEAVTRALEFARKALERHT